MISISSDIIVGSNNLGSNHDFQTFEEALNWIKINIDLNFYTLIVSSFFIILKSDLKPNTTFSVFFHNVNEKSLFYQAILSLKS